MTTAGTLLQHASHAQTGNTYCDEARAAQVMSEPSVRFRTFPYGLFEIASKHSRLAWNKNPASLPKRAPTFIRRYRYPARLFSAITST